MFVHPELLPALLIPRLVLHFHTQVYVSGEGENNMTLAALWGQFRAWDDLKGEVEVIQVRKAGRGLLTCYALQEFVRIHWNQRHCCSTRLLVSLYHISVYLDSLKVKSKPTQPAFTLTSLCPDPASAVINWQWGLKWGSLFGHFNKWCQKVDTPARNARVNDKATVTTEAFFPGGNPGTHKLI